MTAHSPFAGVEEWEGSPPPWPGDGEGVEIEVDSENEDEDEVDEEEDEEDEEEFEDEGEPPQVGAWLRWEDGPPAHLLRGLASTRGVVPPAPCARQGVCVRHSLGEAPCSHSWLLLQGALVDEPEASVPGSHMPEPAEGEWPNDWVLQVSQRNPLCSAVCSAAWLSHCNVLNVRCRRCPPCSRSITRVIAIAELSRWAG